MKFNTRLFITALFFLAIAGYYGCKSPGSETINITPDAGTAYKLGDVVPVKASSSAGTMPDSVVYLIDSIRNTSRKDTLAARIKTDSLPCGSRLVTARFYKGGKVQEASTNIIIKAAAPPVEYTYRVNKVYPHDPASYTEGLEYHDGDYFFESTGLEKESYLLKVDLKTGKRLQAAKLDDQYFGEGIATVGDKILMLTYREGKAFVYDKNTFKVLSTIPYTWGREGWGMCFDGKHILNDDSSNRIFFLNKDTFMPESAIDVYDDKGPVNAVNELEYIDGKIYANVYTTDNILVINPKNGAVLQRIDMSNLWPMAQRPANFDNDQNVLNGIAYDKKGGRIFVTGKKWPHLYQVSFIKK
ncbi:glutamine cyclotransferase [Mucilaginibacter sp. PPCGB 2223]|uniref:glutaminyl-peptide cyclotransferase n=1 Tax=Mucilaginibacter sp. PPCGB 2223 TaxID=1886027 RepID=UPI000824B4A2|nr:glutaminyl-peptide cyclotransferase [Mucilaginibacter sp. PPCGB 2223]OCX50355.1 glutamine cyclotransferase [Mucilaginibacter sp. PPCGB 2223]